MRLPQTTRERRRWAVIGVIALAVFFAGRELFHSVDIEKLLEDLSASLGDWTYLLVGGLAFLETGAFVGLVAPGETAVILGGAVAGQGEINLWLMLAITWFGAWGGDSVSFVIGAKLGRGFILEHGHRVRISRERFAQVEDYFSRHGGKTILIGRFVGIVRALAPFIAGSSGMRYREMLPYSVLGTGIWAASFTLLGYFASKNIGAVIDNAGRATFALASLIVLTVAAIVAVSYLRIPENRKRLVARIEETAAGRRLLGWLRPLKPQARFVWNRITPGGLGLEFTSLVAIAVVGAFVCAAYWGTVAGDAGPTAADRAALDLVRDIEAGWLTSVAKIVTALGGWAPVTIVAAGAALYLGSRRRWAELAVLAASVLAIAVLVPWFKELAARPRIGDPIVTEDNGSYPSGHAAHSVIYAWLALTIILRVRPGIPRATMIAVAGVAVAIAVGISRVYLRAHYLSDVAGGWGLGVAVFAGFAAIALIVTHLRQNSADAEPGAGT